MIDGQTLKPERSCPYLYWRRAWDVMEVRELSREVWGKTRLSGSCNQKLNRWGEYWRKGPDATERERQPRYSGVGKERGQEMATKLVQ